MDETSLAAGRTWLWMGLTAIGDSLTGQATRCTGRARPLPVRGCRASGTATHPRGGSNDGESEGLSRERARDTGPGRSARLEARAAAVAEGPAGACRRTARQQDPLTL